MNQFPAFFHGSVIFRSQIIPTSFQKLPACKHNPIFTKIIINAINIFPAFFHGSIASEPIIVPFNYLPIFCHISIFIKMISAPIYFFPTVLQKIAIFINILPAIFIRLPAMNIFRFRSNIFTPFFLLNGSFFYS